MYKRQARDLVRQMTLEEKVSQMLHGASAIERLGIPAYNWWNEALHGVARAGTATVFPQAIGLAAAFDAELLARIADVIADEGRAKYYAAIGENDRDIYKGLTFWSPNINIFRDPRWGRGHETYGEDPHLTAELGRAFIGGLQGADAEHLKTAACAKHFAVHSGPEADRHKFDAACDDYDLWNTYLYAFDEAVTGAKVAGVMGAYNRTLGEPCCGSARLMTDILFKKWGFKGYFTSDCWAIKDFHTGHMVTADAEESVALAVSKGCHLNCGNLYPYCLDAVKSGKLKEADIDAAVEKLMEIRFRLGILGEDDRRYFKPYTIVDSDEHNAVSLEAARKGIVLLKNGGALPLCAEKIKTIGVIGPNADSRAALEGNYMGLASEYVTVLGGIRALAKESGIRTLYAEGCHLWKDRVSGLSVPDDRVSEAVTVVKNSDAIVLCLGLDANLEGEEGDVSNEFSSGDKNGLELPGRQKYLLDRVVAAAGDKPVVLVLLSGSALAVDDTKLAGVIQAFYPGARGGQAVAEVIFGKVSPSGKLPVTFYKSTADLPDFSDYNMKNRTYRYFEGETLYPFGFGLTYSDFELEYLNFELGIVSVRVRNTGPRAAREVVQIYVSGENLKEKYSLAGFAPIELPAGGEGVVGVPLGNAAFARYDKNGVLKNAPGPFRLHIGFTQPDEVSAKLYGKQPIVIEV